MLPFLGSSVSLSFLLTSLDGAGVRERVLVPEVLFLRILLRVNFLLVGEENFENFKILFMGFLNLLGKVVDSRVAGLKLGAFLAKNPLPRSFVSLKLVF